MTFVYLCQYQTAIMIGFFLGVGLMMTLNMFGMVVLFGGARAGKGTEVAAALFAFALFVCYVSATLALLLRCQTKEITEARMLQGMFFGSLFFYRHAVIKMRVTRAGAEQDFDDSVLDYSAGKSSVNSSSVGDDPASEEQTPALPTGSI